MAKFWETGSVVDTQKGQHRSLFCIITENFQMYGNAISNPSENQHVVPLKKLAFWEHRFWGSTMMTLSSFLTKFKSYRGELIEVKQNEKYFVKISVKGSNWPWPVGFERLNNVDHCGLCGASATLPVSRNLDTKR